MYLHFKFCENPPSGFWDSVSKIFTKKNKKNLYQIKKFEFRKKAKNILAILFFHVLQMSNFKKLALIATKI